MLMIISRMRMVLKIIMIIHGHIDDTDEDIKTTRISSESKNQPPAFGRDILGLPAAVVASHFDSESFYHKMNTFFLFLQYQL